MLGVNKILNQTEEKNLLYLVCPFIYLHFSSHAEKRIHFTWLDGCRTEFLVSLSAFTFCFILSHTCFNGIDCYAGCNIRSKPFLYLYHSWCRAVSTMNKSKIQFSFVFLPSCYLNKRAQWKKWQQANNHKRNWIKYLLESRASKRELLPTSTTVIYLTQVVGKTHSICWISCKT